MWFIFGVIAIIATLFNLYLYKTGKNYHLAMAIALSFTALTLNASYGMVSSWLAAEDWAGILDVVPTMNTALWILTILSILINSAPAILEFKREH